MAFFSASSSNITFKFQKSVYNGCHDLLMLCLGIGNISIITVKNIDYGCIIHDINKSDSIMHLLENSVLDDHGYILIY